MSEAFKILFAAMAAVIFFLVVCALTIVPWAMGIAQMWSDLVG